MASSKNDSSWFDDNFEVTYDDDSTLRPSVDLSIPTNISREEEKAQARCV